MSGPFAEVASAFQPQRNFTIGYAVAVVANGEAAPLI